MFVTRKKMEAALEKERAASTARLFDLTRSYGDALTRTAALQHQLSAWVMNKPGNITPEQMATMFYAQDDSWQASFFNCMQDVVQAHHDALPPARPGGMPNPSAGHPAGEGQWWHMAAKLNPSGFETVEAMFDHARYHHDAKAAA